MDEDKKPEWSDSNNPENFATVIKKGVEHEGNHNQLQKNRFQKRNVRDLPLKNL